MISGIELFVVVREGREVRVGWHIRKMHSFFNL
jgi:hypothetical protein